MRRTTSTGLAIVLLTLAATLFGVVVCGCVPAAQARAIPSVLDPSALDVKAVGTPATIPPISTGVPKSSILQVDQWIAESPGRQLHSQRWVDFQNHRARWDWYLFPAEANLGGSSTTAGGLPAGSILASVVVDGNSSFSYDGYGGRVNAGAADETGIFDGSDQDPGWSGRTPVLIGHQLLGGAKVDVYRIDLNIPSGQERSADFALIYVDSATGLRVRDEWLLGSPGDAWVFHLFEYRLVARTDALEASMMPDAVKGQRASVLAARLRAARDMGFPVWGLPAGTSGLVLSGVTISASETQSSVLLYYRPDGSVGQPAFSIETIDVRGRSDFPADLLVPREKAVAKSGGDVLDFGLGTDVKGHVQTAVRMMRWPESGAPAGLPSLAELAGELVDVTSQ
jgi:hypothetical protein